MKLIRTSSLSPLVFTVLLACAESNGDAQRPGTYSGGKPGNSGATLGTGGSASASSSVGANGGSKSDGGGEVGGYGGDVAGQGGAPVVAPPFLPTLAEAYRAPAYPLITHDPYFSIWSFADSVTAEWPRHWTGAVHALTSFIRVDGKTFRLLGSANAVSDVLTQDKVWVLPTRTIYRLSNEDIEVDLVFASPLLPAELDVLSRPVSYITWHVRAKGAEAHDVQIYFDASAELVVDKPDQAVTWETVNLSGHHVRRIGTQAQPVLGRAGDDLRIDWGYLYHAVKAESGVDQKVQSDSVARTSFASSGALSGSDDTNKPRAASDQWPVIATTFDLGSVGTEATSRTMLLAYDDLYSIEYLGERLRPYWRKSLSDVNDLISTASAEYQAIDERLRTFDAELIADLDKVGGAPLRKIGSLAFRQAISAHKVVLSPEGKPWFFSKENFSNGCIATVDVTYPSAPLFLLMQPALLEGMLEPMMKYADSGRWKFPFAPHDLGTYPLANGQVYGGGENSEVNQMPVEESGNMLILIAALSQATGSTAFAETYFPLLTRWAEYLSAQGFDPDNQLSTDDFAGHLAHNVNLSAKAIIALGAYADLCEKTNRADEAAKYRAQAEDFAKKWAENANDGDHFSLAFDKPGTWSQKYNLAMDRLLGTNLFDSAVTEKEMAFYRKHQNSYGLPLDSRRLYTKLDWIVWTGTLTGERDDLDALLEPVSKFLAESPSRVPMTDWYETVTGNVEGFRARSVVGGVYLPLMHDAAILKKWLERAK